MDDLSNAGSLRYLLATGPLSAVRIISLTPPQEVKLFSSALAEPDPMMEIKLPLLQWRS